MTIIFEWSFLLLVYRQVSRSKPSHDWQCNLFFIRISRMSHSFLLMIDPVQKPQDDSYLMLFPDGSKDLEPVAHDKNLDQALEIAGTWWTLGVVATAGLFGTQTPDAIAAEESVTSAITTAAREAPGWVAPSVLAFPVVSYVLFTLYRNKVGGIFSSYLGTALQ